jgi:membrane protein
VTASLAALDTLRSRLGELSQTLQQWPWLDTARTLRERFREDRLGLTASSLTFTTLIALVPLVTVMLAVFSAFPMFAGFQRALEQWFVQSLVPDGIAKPVLAALTQFAGKAARMGSAGLALLVLTALALMLTIDRALNSIWRVRRPRGFTQRVLVYWSALTLGPLLLGVSLSLTTWVLGRSRMLGSVPGGLSLLLNSVEFVLMTLGMAGLFHYVPNTHVRWRHALAGGVFVALGLEVAKRLLGWYVGSVPTYSAVYGAFATVPILLLWIYVGWLIVLWGAVIAAYAPSLSMHVTRMRSGPGQRFTLSVAVLQVLARSRSGSSHGLMLHQIAAATGTDPLQVEPVVDTLVEMDWVGRLDEEGGQRLVLLADPATTPAAPLIDSMLIAPAAAARAMRERIGVDGLKLQELIAPAG